MFKNLLLLFTLLLILINLEGFERKRSKKEYLRFLSIAKGSVGEVRSLLTVAYEVGYIDISTHQELRELTLKISRMLGKQMRVIESYITTQNKPNRSRYFSFQSNKKRPKKNTAKTSSNFIKKKQTSL